MNSLRCTQLKEICRIGCEKSKLGGTDICWCNRFKSQTTKCVWSCRGGYCHLFTKYLQNIYKYAWQMDLSSLNVSSTDMLIANIVFCADLGICSISIHVGYGWEVGQYASLILCYATFTDGNWTRTEKPVPSHWVIWAFLSNWSDIEWRRPKRQKAWGAKTGQGWFGQICPTLSSEASKAKDPPHKNGTICNHHCEWGPTFLFPPEIKGNLPLKTAAIWTTRWSQDCKLIVLYLCFIFSWSLSNLILRKMLNYIK